MEAVPLGIRLIAPVILVENWRELYTGLWRNCDRGLRRKMKGQMFLEIILMTYSYVHRAINGGSISQRAGPLRPGAYDRLRAGGVLLPAGEQGGVRSVSARGDRTDLGDVRILYIS